jgi:Ca-activated chloride channel family protein
MIPEGAVFRFAFPLALLALVIPVLVAWWSLRPGRRPRLVFSDLRLVVPVSHGWRTRLRGLPLVLRVLALALLVVAMARPQAENRV